MAPFLLSSSLIFIVLPLSFWLTAALTKAPLLNTIKTSKRKALYLASSPSSIDELYLTPVLTKYVNALHSITGQISPLLILVY